jgi:hypothetical protein
MNFTTLVSLFLTGRALLIANMLGSSEVQDIIERFLSRGIEKLV